MTMRSKKPLPLALHRRRHHSKMKGYKNWCTALISASTMVDTMSKINVRCVHQMAIYMVCNIYIYIYIYIYIFLIAHRNLLSG